MPDLSFKILSAEVRPFAVQPTIIFNLQITNAVAGEEIYAAALKCQLMLEAGKRQYEPDVKAVLLEVFGPPGRWEETMRDLFWMVITIPVPKFTGETIIDVSVSCSEDQAIAAGKFFYAMKDGKIPLAFLFSGTMFYQSEDNELHIFQVPWHLEAAFSLDVKIWNEMMEVYFPHSRAMHIRKDIFDKLYKYKALNAIPTLEQALEQALNIALKEKQLENNTHE